MRWIRWGLAACIGMAVPAAAQDVTAEKQQYLLRVIMNGDDTGKLVSFIRLQDGQFASTPENLRLAGIRAEEGAGREDGYIPLNQLSDVKWQYDDVNQVISFEAPDKARQPLALEVGGGEQTVDLSSIRADFGYVLNYTLYGNTGFDWRNGNESGTSLSGSLENRLLTPFGIGSTSLLARSQPFRLEDRFSDIDVGVTRLDSSWRFTDPKRLIVYQFGDAISSALPWNSSYRLGGIQIRRNFDLRPDLVTAPVPNLAGSAAVPSTVDLYLNNIKVFSGDVPAGPFKFSSMPILGSGGEARIVMRDALGREVVTQQKYFYAPDLLRPGYLDFSAEAGFVRLGYAEDSFLYDKDIAGSASLRYGLNDRITLQGHVEATSGLLNGGAGIVTSLGPYGSVSGSLAGSTFEGEGGAKISALYQTQYEGYSFYVGTDRTFGEYNDVGLVVDRHRDYQSVSPLSARSRSVDRVGVSFPLGFDPSSLNLSYVRVNNAHKQDSSNILSVSWSRSIFSKANLYVSGYFDLDDSNRTGMYAGLSIPIGHNLSASSNVSASDDRITFDNSLYKSASTGEGSINWSLRDRQVTNHGGGSRSATVNYDARLARLSGSVDQSEDQANLAASVEGSVVAAGGGVFMSRHIDDAFAIVKAGGPNVDVSLNHSRVAKTNRSGRALIPSLRSYEQNTISIDPANLPLDFQADSTQSTVIVADRSGAVVDFGTKHVDAAMVVLHGADGKPLPLGALVQLEGAKDPTFVGYDGRTYLSGLSARNTATITLPEAAGTCQASFGFRAVKGTQQEIGPISCR